MMKKSLLAALAAISLCAAPALAGDSPRVRITIGGDAGRGFTASCLLDGAAPLVLSGQAPLDLSVAADAISCEVTAGPEPGALEVTLEGPGGNRSRSRSTGPGAHLSISQR